VAELFAVHKSRSFSSLLTSDTRIFWSFIIQMINKAETVLKYGFDDTEVEKVFLRKYTS
jgi:hypothetical protein